jgi:hypothetical protein
MLTRPRLLLHLEGAVVFALTVVLYWRIDGNWLLFVVLLLAPDVGMLGYVRNTRLGAATYNAFHTYAAALLLAGAGFLLADALLQSLGVIWVAHIGLDRALGFGLKYPTVFKDTHLGRL